MFVRNTRSVAWNMMAKRNKSDGIAAAVVQLVQLPPPNPKTFSFLCQDQTVKVDSNIYHLDRFRSSLKSKYFEKLLTCGDFAQRNENVLEIQPKNSEIFSSVIDLIHGKKLIDVLSKDNCILLLEAMDHLEMTIDLKIVNSFIDENFKTYSSEDAKIFELYAFAGENDKFEYLLTSIFEYFANNLTTITDHKILASMSLEHLIRIVQSVREMNDEKRYHIVRLCTEWLSRDLESRLPHLTMLINSIKPGFHTEEADTVKRLPKFDVDEQAKRKTIAACVFSLLAYGGKLNPTILKTEEMEFFEDYSGYETDYDEYCWMKRAEYDEYEPKASHNVFANPNNEYDKLKKFLDNGDFYDITVRVGEKPYKLHRAVLESKCGYFTDIFEAEYDGAVTKSDEKLEYPCKNKEYLLDAVDQPMFDTVFDFIYFDKDIVRWDYENFVRIFKIADILKIEELLKILTDRLIEFPGKINSSDVVELLNFTDGKQRYEKLYVLYFCEHMNSEWPKIYSKSKFCSIPWTMLENMLKSSNFRPNDPRKILDICSTWIIHDFDNRYGFLPEIAQIVNPYCSLDDNTFKTKFSADANDCSQQFVRDKLWQILSTVPYVASSESSTKDSSEVPVWIANKKNENGVTICVLNADFDEITSFSSFLPSETGYISHFLKISLSATMIGDDNLFIIQDFRNNSFIHQVFNFSSKKCFRLNFDAHYSIFSNEYTLLNCNNEMYCCSRLGLVMKFSMQLNRWIIISKRTPNKSYHKFASDGEMLYTICTESGKSLCIKSYDFETNSWSPMSDVPELNCMFYELHITVVNGRDVAVVTYDEILLFDRGSKKWRISELPRELSKVRKEKIVSCEDRMSLVVGNQLYDVSNSCKNFELKKELPEGTYGCIAAIHKPRSALVK